MTTKSALLSTKIRVGLWRFGTLLLIIAMVEHSFAFFADGVLSAAKLLPMLIIFSLCLVWYSLKPRSLNKSAIVENINTLKFYKIDSGAPQYEAYRHKTEARMLQIARHHLITQEYILPIPYLCQVYHLLNLKHLESVHAFSLNQLKVTGVNQFKATASGGIIKFQTVLDSSLNLLKVLRRPTVEVELTLHTPYTIELSIPAYKGKNIMIVFNILPLSDREHKLFIDIYSDLILPRPMLQILFHFASSLTLLEDLPYLRRLARSNLYTSGRIGKSNHQMMQLFNRFIELYGSSLQEPPAIGGVKLWPMNQSNPV